MNTPPVNPYRVSAFNISQAVENKIHEDSVAQKLGFKGGLVPGVEVYAYMTHPVVAAWGRDWLAHGAAEVRFVKPVYDGHIAEVTATSDTAGDMALSLTSDDIACASGLAHGHAAAAAPHIDTYPSVTPPANRPPADETSLAAGLCLGMKPVALTEAVHATYLADVRENLSIYTEAKIAHPGWMLRACNSVLRDSVVLAPWIHTGSQIRNCGTLHVGETISARARIVANYERKGHRFVDLDVILLADSSRVVAQVLHTAAYRLRQLSEGA